MLTKSIRFVAILILTGLAASGCSTVTPGMILTSEGAEQSTLLVYRESKFFNAGASMLLGTENGYFLSLDNASFTRINMDAGSYELLAKNGGRPRWEAPAKLRVDLKSNQTTCVLGSPSGSLSIGISTGKGGTSVSSRSGKYGFTLSEDTCPTDDALESLAEIDAETK